MTTRYNNIILIGANKIACDCLERLAKSVNKSQIYVIETQKNELSMLRKKCHSLEVKYKETEDNNLADYLKETIKDDPTLIISANNRYIFKKDIIEKKGVDIINFHYAYLPNYRGVNIPSWVIYNDEEYTGVTWHYVTERIDCGKIICQEKIQLDEDMTAFDVTRLGMNLGIVLFDQFIDDLLDHEIDVFDISYPQDSVLYHSSRLPGEGIIQLDMPIEYIYKMLRCYEYRGVSIFPRLRIEVEKHCYNVVRYKKSEVENNITVRDLNENIITCIENGMKLIITVE